MKRYSGVRARSRKWRSGRCKRWRDYAPWLREALMQYAIGHPRSRLNEALVIRMLATGPRVAPHPLSSSHWLDRTYLANRAARSREILRQLIRPPDSNA